MQTAHSVEPILIFSSESRANLLMSTFSLSKLQCILSFYAFNFQTLSVHLLNCPLFITAFFGKRNLSLHSPANLRWQLQTLTAALSLGHITSSLLPPPAPLPPLLHHPFYLIPLKFPFYLPRFSKTLPMSLSDPQRPLKQLKQFSLRVP